MKSGFTTGTCSAVAAKAAALMLFTGKKIKNMKLMTPKGTEADLPLFHAAVQPERAVCAVRKDAGDDPDVTDQALIFASVEYFHGQAEENWYQEEDIYLEALEGIGVVTKPGLSCAVGMPAINPVPRRMIFEAVAEIRNMAEKEGPLKISLWIPEGRELAKKTFNSRLGIEGGLSILGTTGIVEPMSEEALLATIRLELHVKAAAGKKKVILTPGNYGEAFLKEELGLKLKYAVTCSNFLADSLLMAKEEGFEQVLLVGHLGKFIKAAGGVPNTHSKYGDRRMEILWDCAKAAVKRRRGGIEPEFKRKLLEANTTEEAVEILKEQHMLEPVMAEAVKRIQYYAGQWSKGLSVEVVTFSTRYGILGMSCGAEKIISGYKEDEMAGKMYGIGVGPGDPELMTIKAVKRIKSCEVIAIPHEDKEACVAYKIVKEAVPEVEDKECLYLPMPMTRDKEILRESHDRAARAVMECLDRGENVAFITLGDVTIYSTCSYLLERLKREGYEVELDSGIPSFCAAAARLGLPLVSGSEELHIIPAAYQIEDSLKLPGIKVLMKAGSQMGKVREEIRKSGCQAVMVENCGLPGERVYEGLEDMPDTPGYYSLLIVR